MLVVLGLLEFRENLVHPNQSHKKLKRNFLLLLWSGRWWLATVWLASLGLLTANTIMSRLNQKLSRFAPIRPRASEAAAKPTLDEEELEECHEAFNLFDTDGNGFIDAKELRAACRALGFVVKSTEVVQMLRLVAKEDEGTVTFEDFVKARRAVCSDLFLIGTSIRPFSFSSLHESPLIAAICVRFDAQIVTPKIKGRDEHEEIMKIFDLFDEDGSGEITFRNLKRVAVRFHSQLRAPALVS